MVVDERARLGLHQRLEAVLGDEAAVTLMQHLPPGGWTDLATKGDINGLDHRFDGLGQRIDGLEQRFDGLERRMDRFENRFENRMDRSDDQMERLHQRMDSFHQELRTQTRVFILAMLGAMVTNTSIIVAAIRFR